MKRADKTMTMPRLRAETTEAALRALESEIGVGELGQGKAQEVHFSNAQQIARSVEGRHCLCSRVVSVQSQAKHFAREGRVPSSRCRTRLVGRDLRIGEPSAGRRLARKRPCISLEETPDGFNEPDFALLRVPQRRRRCRTPGTAPGPERRRSPRRRWWR